MSGPVWPKATVDEHGVWWAVWADRATVLLDQQEADWLAEVRDTPPGGQVSEAALRGVAAIRRRAEQEAPPTLDGLTVLTAQLREAQRRTDDALAAIAASVAVVQADVTATPARVLTEAEQRGRGFVGWIRRLLGGGR